MSMSIIFTVSFVSVFFKTFQQKNVIQDKYIWILPTSMCMAFLDALLWISIIKAGIGIEVVAFGLGAGLGCLASIVLHKRLFKDKRKGYG